MVNQVFQQEHTKKQLLILRLINRLVNNRVIEVRFVCEFMLNNLVYSSGSSQAIANSKSLQNPTNTFIWCKVLESIRKFIPIHDYKSCRDIFKMLLEVIKRIPHSNSSFPPHLETELLFIKSPNKRKLLSDYNNFQDSFANTLSKNSTSMVTDDIKLESLYEVFKTFNKLMNLLF